MSITRWAAALALICLGCAAQAANRPQGFTTVCNEGKVCVFSHVSGGAGVLVAFGRADGFRYKRVMSGFLCSAATFGGRVVGGVNECSVDLAATPTYGAMATDLEPGIVSGPATPTGYVECGLLGQRCEFAGTREVRLGGVYAFGSSLGGWTQLYSGTEPAVFTNGVPCKASSFPGYQPRPYDRCYVKQTTTP